MQMEMFAKANGRTIRPTGSVSTYTMMGLNMWASGKRINIMEKAKKTGLMALIMKVTISMERKMEMDFLDGLMVQPTMDNSQTTINKEKVCIFGVMMDVSTKVNGRCAKCMAKVYFNGLMVASTKVTIITT
jgi:hypothetical protein